MNPPQPNSMGQLHVAAVGLHELYQSYVQAGFTKQQAFELVRTILANGITQQVEQQGGQSPFPG